MKVLRSTFVAAVAMIAAACGDKVTVAGPTTTTLTMTTTTTTTPAAAGKVLSVAVAPATATLTVGQTINLTAAVQADAGIATTVTWTSSDTSKASVTTAGVVTAKAATPGVAICATSTVNTSMKGCASIVVSAAAVTVPASATILGVFQNNLTTPVDPSNVNGNVFVQVNLNPGTQVISKVVLTLGGVRVDSQSFSAAQSAALRYAADQAAAEQTSVATITLTVNTAAVVNGVPVLTNGANKTVAVLVYTTGSTTAPTATATNAASVTLNNLDKILATVAPASGTVTTAASVTGYAWTKLTDSTDVQFTYVSYSGRTPTSLNVTPFCADTAWTKVISPFKVRYGQSATGYQTQNSVGVCSATATTDGESPVFNSAVMSDGNAPPTGLAMDAATVAALRKRYDNVGPTAAVIAVNAGISGTKLSRGQGWLNDAVKLTTVRSSSSEGTTANFTGAMVNTRGTDNGVSAGASATNNDPQVVSYKAYIGADLATALASTAITTTAGIAETAGQTMCLVVRSADALGNLSPAPTTCNFNSGTNTAAEIIGIDRTAPNYARYQPRGADTVGGTYSKLAPDSLWAGNRIVVFAGDTGTAPGSAGASGIRGVAFSITRTDNGFASCIYGTSSSCLVSSTGTITAPLGLVGGTSTDDFGTAAIATDGYYAISATAYDLAGNSLAVAARNVLRDGTAPANASIVGLAAIQSGLQSGRVTVASDDAIGLAAVQLANSYTDGTLTLSYVCARADIATTMAAASLVVSDARALTGCSAPASLLLKTDTVASTLVNFPGTLLLPNSAGNVAFGLSANATSTTIDWSGQRTSNAVALNTIGSNTAPLYTGVDTSATLVGGVGGLSGIMTDGTHGQRANNATICPNAFNGMGFCNFTVSRSGTSVFTGTGVNAATSVDLRATVSVQDSVGMPGATSDSTAAQRKTAALANLRNNVTASPFRSVTFLVYPAISCTGANTDQFGANANCTASGAGIGEGQPVGSAGSTSVASPGVLVTGALDVNTVTNGVTGLQSETIDSTTNNTMYVVNRTWRYVGTFVPDKYLGTYVPVLGRSTDFTATLGTVRFYGIGNYGFPATSSGTVIFPQAGTLNAGIWSVGGTNAGGTSFVTGNNAAVSTTRRSRIAVLSPRGGAISVRR